MRALNSTVSILCYACVASWAARVARQTRLKFAPRLSRTSNFALLCQLYWQMPANRSSKADRVKFTLGFQRQFSPNVRSG